MPYRTPAIPCVDPAPGTLSRAPAPAPAVRHARRTVVALTAAAAAFAAFAWSVVTDVPSLAPDDAITVERAQDFPPPKIYMFMSTDPADFTAPSDVVLRGTITLRGHKTPFERIARAPR